MITKKLKKEVEFVLQNYPDTRNSDIRLTQAVWFLYYKQLLKQEGNEWLISLKNLFDVPSQDNIKRIRATFQNDKRLYLPTEWLIAKKRGWLEEDYRKALGYNPEMRSLAPDEIADQIKGKVTDQVVTLPII